MKKRMIAVLCVLTMVFMCVCAAAEEGDIVIPEVKVKQFEIPDNEAMVYLRSLGMGWNLGNTMDATNDGYLINDLTTETCWNNPYTTREMIASIAEQGFRTIRIPVSWHNHVNKEFVINSAWLDRVQQIVDWALEYDLHVIINIHHDNEKEFMYPDQEHMENTLRYVTSIWEQVAARFVDYDERLIFEALNEPRLKGNEKYEWVFDRNSEVCLESAECINQLNQAFVDTVRASGGSNAGRYLMVPGYDASPSCTDPAFFRLPEDSADNRIIVSVHGYTPYNFALMPGGVDTFDITLPRDTGEIGMMMNTLYERFISKGIPVVMGECGAVDRNNLQARVDWSAYYVASGAARGIPCIWWDNGSFSGSGENFALLNRYKVEWPYPEIVEAMMRYALK